MLNAQWERYATQIRNVCPGTPPDDVVDEHWGEYAEVEWLLTCPRETLTSKGIFSNRSMITFTNDRGAAFLIPHYIVASFDGAQVAWDVLDYVILELLERGERIAELMSLRQREALLSALRFIDEFDGRDAHLKQAMKVLV